MDEDGSDLAGELWRRASSVASSVLAYPEGRAALAAARRVGRLSARQLRRAVAGLDALHDELVLIGVDDELARQAGELAERRALRGYEAVHLATALALGADAVVVVTWDADLSRAAHAEGRAVAPSLPEAAR